MSQYNDKHAKFSSKKAPAGLGDDEDAPNQVGSDGEQEDVGEEDTYVIDTIKENMATLVGQLEDPVEAKRIPTTYDTTTFVPLGHFRMGIIQLFLNIVKLRKPMLIEAMQEAKVFTVISGLAERYPWNNCAQLKIISLYEEVIEGSSVDSSSLRERVLTGSNLAEALCSIQTKPDFIFDSTNTTRYGGMAFTIKIGDLL